MGLRLFLHLYSMTRTVLYFFLKVSIGLILQIWFLLNQFLINFFSFYRDACSSTSRELLIKSGESVASCKKCVYAAHWFLVRAVSLFVMRVYFGMKTITEAFVNKTRRRQRKLLWGLEKKTFRKLHLSSAKRTAKRCPLLDYTSIVFFYSKW